jgi:hypothetical protein
MIEGTIARADDDRRGFAEVRVEQVGYTLASATRRIMFHDRSRVGVVLGGWLRAGDAVVRVTSDRASARVWTNDAGCAERASPSAFDEMFTEARGAAGCTRTVLRTIGVGERVYVAGELVRAGEELLLRAGPEGDLIVASEDPRPFLRSRQRLLAAIGLGEIAACALATRLALAGPRFGPTSMLGALACLAFFLLGTPVAAWARAISLSPDHIPSRETWIEPHAPFQG